MAAVRAIPLAYNTIYVVDDGPECILVDTGPDYRGAREAIEAALAGRLPDLVIATHGHLDHAGLATCWQSRGVPVALGRADAHLAGRSQLSDPAEFAALTRFVEGSGAPPEVQAEALAGIERRREWAIRAAATKGYPVSGRGGRWPTGLRCEPFEPDVLVEGDWQVGTTGLRTLASPGHTLGNLVVVHEGEGWLLSGDQLLPEMTPTPAIQAAPPGSGDWRFRSLPAFVTSLERLHGLGLRRCFPGHGEPFDDVPGAIAANLAMIEERTEKALAELEAGGPATLYALSERLYPRAVRRRFWQIVATVQGHLDLLEAEGRVREVGGSYEVA